MTPYFMPMDPASSLLHQSMFMMVLLVMMMLMMLVRVVVVMMIVIIVRNILECILNHSFSYECICSHNIMFFLTLFT